MYTKEWERRVFKRIGRYLMRHNTTMHECFSLIQDDNSQTISVEEMKRALSRFDLQIGDNGMKVFMKKDQSWRKDETYAAGVHL